MVARITHGTIQRSTLANLQTNLTAVARLQAQMSSGTKISVPSDDPAGAHDVLRLRADQRTAVQHKRNTDDGDAWLTTIDTALQASLAIVRRTRDLAVRAGAQGSLGPDSREALAAEVEARRDELLQQANATYSGRHVFAGTSAGAAFTVDTSTPTRTYVWSGTPAATVTREVGPGTNVRVDADGSAVFGVGGASVFAALDRLAADIRAGADISPSIDAIDAHMSSMLREVAAVGARHNQVLGAKDVLAERDITLRTQVSALVDVDLAAIIVEIQSQELAYRGALGAASKVLAPSLMDFLR